jgi:hypothetical protein
VSTTDLVFQGLLGPHLHDGHTRELGVVAWRWKVTRRGGRATVKEFKVEATWWMTGWWWQVRKKMTVGMGEGGRQRAGYLLCVRLSAPRACKTKITVYFQ